MRKNLDEIDFTDNYMFCSVLTKHKDLCKKLVEIILDIKIKDIKYIIDEKQEKVFKNSKGIRMDVYVDDDADRVFDLEMQVERVADMPKRARYYHSVIDNSRLKEGKYYDALKKTFVIFICMFDYFGYGLPVYTFENFCRQDKEIALNDEAYTVFLNPYSNVNTGYDELDAFLKYLVTKERTSDFTDSLDDAIIELKKSNEWREAYMFEDVAAYDIEKAGIAKGIEIGIEQGRFSMLKKMLAKNIDDNVIISLGYTAEDIKKCRCELTHT